MFGRRHADLPRQGLPRQGHRPNKQRSGSEPELSALFTGTPAHLVAAEVARLQQAVGNRGAAALLAQRPDAAPPPAHIQRCGEPGCDCVEDHSMCNETATRVRVPFPLQ